MIHEKQETILSFWFGDDSLHPLTNQSMWFSRTGAFDSIITERFAHLVEDAANGAFEDWVKTPRGALALVILLDQFPRHLWRNTDRAFSLDPHARRVAEMAIDHGFDKKLNVVERIFLYLPLEHSEDLVAQERSVRLYSDLQDDAIGDEKSMIAEALDYAIRHRNCIAKFGRFPHRNAILGREDTKDEREFLKRPGSHF